MRSSPSPGSKHIRFMRHDDGFAGKVAQHFSANTVSVFTGFVFMVDWRHCLAPLIIPTGDGDTPDSHYASASSEHSPAPVDQLQPLHHAATWHSSRNPPPLASFRPSSRW